MKSRHWRWKIRRRLEASCKRGTRVVSSPRRLVNSGFVCKHYLFLAVPRSFSRGLPVKGNDDVSATVEEEQGRKREAEEEGRGRKRGEVLRRMCGRTDGRTTAAPSASSSSSSSFSSFVSNRTQRHTEIT